MPKMNGLDLLMRMKVEEPFKHIPVIMQTVLDREEEIAEGIEAGAYYYLTKPFDKKMLQVIVKAAIKDKQAVEDLLAQAGRISDNVQIL